jgi:ABC-type glycerol-3-phosphate transport system permease component
MAAAIIAALPTLLVYVVAGAYFVRGPVGWRGERIADGGGHQA